MTNKHQTLSSFTYFATQANFNNNQNISQKQILRPVSFTLTYSAAQSFFYIRP